jgi:hypothetical protein
MKTKMYQKYGLLSSDKRSLFSFKKSPQKDEAGMGGKG